MQIIGLAVIGDFPKGGGFGNCIGAARAKGGQFMRRFAMCVAETFAGSGIVKPDGATRQPDGFKKIQGARGNAFQSLYGLFEGQADRTLSGQIIDLVGFDARQTLIDAAEIMGAYGGQLDLVQQAEAGQAFKPHILRIAPSPIDLIALAQQKTGEIGAILAGNSGNQCNRHARLVMKQSRVRRLKCDLIACL